MDCARKRKQDIRDQNKSSFIPNFPVFWNLQASIQPYLKYKIGESNTHTSLQKIYAE